MRTFTCGARRSAVGGTVGDPGGTTRDGAPLSASSTARAAEVVGALLDATDDIVLVCRSDGAVIHANRIGAELLGWPDRPAHLEQLLGPRERIRLRDDVLPTTVEAGHWRGELVLEPIDGMERPSSVTVVHHPGPAADGPSGDDGDLFSFHAHDITELREALDRIAAQATRDPLTGLPNRTLLDEHLPAALSRARRSGGIVSVLFVDLDGFKAVNDTLGHEAGDVLLVAVAGRLRAAVRETDLVARLGGDEFVLVLEGLRRPADVTIVAKRVVDAISEPVPLPGTLASVTASVGFALGDGDAFADSLIRQADAAMYAVKVAGKRGIRAYDDELRTRDDDRRTLEEDIRDAVARGELELRSRPLVELATGAAVGADLSVWWHHPQRGLLAPGAFLSAAERTGAVVDIEQWALAQVVTRAAEHGGPGSTWIRASAAHVRRGDFAERLVGLADAADVDTGAIGVRIGHRSVNDRPEVEQGLRWLRLLGVRVAIDDFGVQPIDLDRLQRLDPDCVALDRSLLTGIETDVGARRRIAAAIAAVAALGITVIAKGVATDTTTRLLAELGCHWAHGPLHEATTAGRPLHAHATATLA
jgi:diguanylate cyclase (GGDEF)-like protein